MNTSLEVHIKLLYICIINNQKNKQNGKERIKPKLFI